MHLVEPNGVWLARRVAGLPGIFRVGSAVLLTPVGDVHDVTEWGKWPARVMKIRGLEMDVVLEGDGPEGMALQHVLWTVDARADERSYNAMAHALSHWVNIQDSERKTFRNSALAVSEWFSLAETGDVVIADARDLPLANESVDFIFADPPYSDNLKYSDDDRCIGKLSAFDEHYFPALADALDEMHRVLKPRRYVGIYICDVWAKKRGFIPIGSVLLMMMAERFRVVDHVCVVRHNKQLKHGNRRSEAIRSNTFMRGFNHLIIAKKEPS